MGRGAGQGRKAMWRGGACAALALLAAVRPVSAQLPGPGVALSVPSGLAVQWLETLEDPEGPTGLTLRFRFVAAGIGAAYTADQAAADLEALCAAYVAPQLANPGAEAAQVVLDIADRAVPFGEANEAAVQFFEAYSVQGGTCQWEYY